MVLLVDSFPGLSATNIGWWINPGFHPEIVPSSVTKMNIAGLPGATAKSVLPFENDSGRGGHGSRRSVLGGGIVTTNRL